MRCHVHVVRHLDLADGLCHGRGKHPVSRSQPRQPRPLTERSRHNKVIALRRQRQEAAIRELRIRLVDHDHHVVREEPFQLFGSDGVARRVVRGSEEDQLGPGRQRLLHRLKVQREVLAAGNLHNPRAVGASNKLVDAERGGRVHHTVTRREEEPRRQVQQLIGAVADNDPVRVGPHVLGNRLPHPPLLRVGIDVIARKAGQRLAHLSGGAIRVLVPIQFDDSLLWDAQALSQDLRWLHRRITGHRYQVLPGQPQDILIGRLAHASAASPAFARWPARGPRIPLPAL